MVNTGVACPGNLAHHCALPNDVDTWENKFYKGGRAICTVRGDGRWVDIDE
jgi:hypothetical protein